MSGKGRTVFAREERFAVQHLRQYAAHTPHINRFGVFLKREHNFRRAVPSCRDVFGHEAGVVLDVGCGASETEVADFEIAVGVEEEVRGFQVAVQDVGAVHGFEGA